MSRPPIELTPNQIAEVETLASVLSKEQIADYFDIDRNTLNAIRAAVQSRPTRSNLLRCNNG